MAYQITFAAGLLLLALSIFLLRRTLIFLTHSEKAKGEVVALEKLHRSNSKKAIFKPVFLFTTKSGKEITFRSATASNPPSWKVGEQAVYAFKPEAPQQGKIVTFFGLFGWSVALACLAMPLVVIGAGFLISSSFINTIINSV